MHRLWALYLICGGVWAGTLNQVALAPLPQAAASNSVARVEIAGRVRMYSFFGINGEMQSKNLLRSAYEFDADFGSWHALAPVPAEARMGATAIGIEGKIYLLGGYTFNSENKAQALSDVWRYEPLRQQYERLPAIPTPVFDAAVVAFKQRYLLLLSGRTNDGALNAIQILDVIADKWLPNTEFIGTGLYGHSAGIVDNVIVLCGGARFNVPMVKDECFVGQINEKNVQEIRWKSLPSLDGAGRLFAAATGTRINGMHVVFAGGSLGWHQRNGTDLDARPVNANDEVVAYNIGLERWERWGRLPIAGLNYRGLLELNGGLATVGGIERNLRVTQAVRRFEPPFVSKTD
jgi:N-acetylneuraminic acid mutarotase